MPTNAFVADEYGPTSLKSAKNNMKWSIYETA